MSALEAARSHVTDMVAELEAMVAKHKERLAAVEAEVASEAAKVPTWEDVRALIARVPVA